METEKQRKTRLMREWRKANPDRAKAIKKRSIERNREKYLESSRNTALKIRYGITLVEYNRMLSDQSGCCKICGIKSFESC